jgi:hypothetical protein
MIRVIGQETAKEYFSRVRKVTIRTKTKHNKMEDANFPVYGSCIWGIEKAENPFRMTKINRKKIYEVVYPYLVNVIAKDGYTEFQLPARRNNNYNGFEIITPIINVNNISDLVSGMEGYFMLPTEVTI